MIGTKITNSVSGDLGGLVSFALPLQSFDILSNLLYCYCVERFEQQLSTKLDT